MAIGVRRSFGIGALELATASRAALDTPLADEAELWIGRPDEDAVALGAFQRAGSRAPLGPVLVQRGSGGPGVRMGAGTLWLALLLPRVDALVACDESRLVNRYVRPLLRALTRCGAQAHFFGRDWVSVERRPAGWVGFAHDRGSGRAVIEAFVARETPFDVGARASYLGKEPGTLASIVGARVEEARLAEAIVTAYADAYGRTAVDRGGLPTRAVTPSPSAAGGEGSIDPPWAATVEEVIGQLGAGPDAAGRFRVGGELLVSRDALGALEAALGGVTDEEVGALVDATLEAPGVALDGVKSLASVRDVIVAARRG
jgi:hypothetical protein